MNLWTLKFSGTETLPLLQRGSESLDVGGNLADLNTIGVYGDAGAKGVKDPIDVVNDFAWTVSPASSRQDIPHIQLIEQRVVLNSVVSNMVYSALASVDTVKSAGITIADTVSDLGSLFTRFTAPVKTEGTDTGSSESVTTTTNKTETSKFKQKVVEQYEKALNTGYFRTFANPVLKPYEGLYATELTGFNYYFPFLDDNSNTVSNSFGEGESNMIGPIQDFVQGVSEGLAGIANILRPGTYIEKSKQFGMQDMGRSINFKIPLLNTQKPEDVSKNWQLIFGLIYQNRPGRVSKSIIDQPVIYEVNIPGIAYMPYAYISNLSVKFLGNRRKMKFAVPVRDPNNTAVGTIETIVPDAYELDITVQGLNDETRNFLYASVSNAKLQVNGAV